MKKNKTNVSVCMAVYNGQSYLREQLDSVLKQLGQNDELIVTDDQSTDLTESILLSYKADKRIHFYRNPNKLGVIKNFEFALSKAKGDYIFLCDQDDVWLSGKVDKCTKLLKDNILVLSDCVVVNSDKRILFKSFFSVNKSKKGILNNLYKNSYMGSCMAFRKELLLYALPIPEKVSMHDVWIGLLAEVKGKVCFLTTPLILYRRHNATATTLKSSTPFLNKVINRFNLFFYFQIRVFRLLFLRNNNEK